MLNKKQFVVIGLVVVLMATLFSLDTKGLISAKQQEENVKPFEITLEAVSLEAKKGLNNNLLQQIVDLEKELKASSVVDQLSLEKQLAQKWDDIKESAPSAFYYELVANKEKSYSGWLKAGDKFTAAYQSFDSGSDDAAVGLHSALVQKAILAYQKAEELQPSSLDSKIGLGVAYVSGTSDPMKGITLLLDVVKQDPNNVKANMSLGLFSMKSGQYKKAVKRFKIVTSQINQPEPWFYLASSYENVGMNEEAILAYVKAKELAVDPSLSRFVDNKVKELKKVN